MKKCRRDIEISGEYENKEFWMKHNCLFARKNTCQSVDQGLKLNHCKEHGRYQISEKEPCIDQQ